MLRVTRKTHFTFALLVLLSLLVLGQWFSMLPAQILYGEGQLGSEVYSDLISKKVGDLIRVVVVQNAQANQNMQSARNRSAKLDAATEIPAGAGFLSPIPTGAGSASLSGQTQKSGSRSTSRQTSFVATVTATIVEVLENGNLRISGTQQTAIDDQETEIFVEGIVRPLDIAPDNSIISTALAEANIRYVAPRSAVQKQGPIVRVITFPFRFVGSLLGLLF
ncbi:hypothetical protein CMK19_11815 [Candidatus Poribacteria bacterium]|nr:hypothetical protein [Candidatus Poribacteria bacterium]